MQLQRLCRKLWGPPEKSSKPGAPDTYYKEISAEIFEDAKQKINNTLEKALTKNEITRDEYNAMLTTDKGPGKFYQIGKYYFQLVL